jgi:hypothetical protein
MPLGQVIGCELGGHAAPGKPEPRGQHRERHGRAAIEHLKHVGQHARQREDHQHDRDRQSRGIRATERRGGKTCADHADHDRAHRQVLVPSGVLPEHPLSEEHQRQQAGGERRLDNHQRSQQERHDLQGPAQDREAGPGQPARTAEQVAGQREAQVLLGRRLLGLECLEADP